MTINKVTAEKNFVGMNLVKRSKDIGGKTGLTKMGRRCSHNGRLSIKVTKF